MTDERWREIERLYHAAVEREPAERAAFLTDACAGDEALGREVQSLLDARPTGGDFMEEPAAEAYLPFLPEALRSVGDPKPPPAPGQLVGRSLGTYQLQALIGAGGMGEVYRAVDTRLNRTIAIKVLPAGVSNDAERRDRFRREAKIVSSLNHPHICALYDVGVDEGIQYLVMEHIEGETLHDWLKQGPVAPARALEYCLQICDALDKAHRQGIVHRDLKPANIMLTRSGVKLLDFGAATWAALSIQAAPVTGTESTGALTETGVIVGTRQYLSPEQLEGRPADRRSDIFMFGAVAYEMLAGKSAFSGGSEAGIISAILKDDPPALADVVPDISSAFARSISRCLSKAPDDRWQTATDLLFQLRSIGATGESVAAGSRSAQRVPGWVERVAWVALAVALMITVYVATSRRARPAEQEAAQAAVRFTLSPPEGTSLHTGYDVPFALSPDGSYIVYVGDKADGTHQLWLRRLTSDVDQPIAGTEGANTPFWSPDSQWIGFFTGNDLRKVQASTGITQLVASNVTTIGGATWNANDAIVFPATIRGLSQVSARSGAVSAVTTPGEGAGHFWPQFVGDGTHFIYAAAASASIDIASVIGEAPRTLMKFPVRVSSLAYVPGYVLFVQDGAMFARPFDDTRLEFSGEEVKILEGIPVARPSRAAFSVSAAGVLAYWPYAVGTPALLRWYDRSGRPSPAVDTAAQYAGFALSSDDRQLLFSRTAKNGGADVWIRDLVGGSERQLTFDDASFTPRWSPDGTGLVFSSPGRNPPPKLRTMSVARAGSEHVVGESPTANFASSWSGDGDSIVSVRLSAATRHDLWVQRVKDNTSERLPLNSPSNESDGKVSPDGRWIAYVTDASGKNEVWVANFPSGEGERPVSAGGGESPQWASGGSELLYLSGKTNPAGPADRQVMAVTFNTKSDDIVLGKPRALFPIKDLAETDWSVFFPTANTFAAAHDGQRFLAAIRTRDPNVPPINFVVNWRALLKRSP